VGLVALLALVVLPEPRRVAGSAIRGLTELTVDLRVRPIDHPETAPGRRVGDPIRHFGALKKSLLQSVPWGVLAALPLVGALRRRAGRGRLLLLAAAS